MDSAFAWATVIAALAAAVVSIINAIRMPRKIAEAQAQGTLENSQTQVQLAEVHGIVNSQRLAMQEKIDGLENLVTEMKSTQLRILTQLAKYQTDDPKVQ